MMTNKAIFNKLIDYGFTKRGKLYVYKTNIMDGDFCLEVKISQKSDIQTKLTENETGEIYTLHLAVGAEGNFIGKVRSEYEKVINDIKAKCFENNVFQWDNTLKVLDYVRKKYDTSEEYLWKKFPRNAVCRRKDNKKWYMAVLSLNGTKLGLADEIIEVLDLRCNSEEIPQLIKNSKYHEAYHMNKKHWITIVLDGSVDLDEIFTRIDNSFILAKK